MSKVMELKSESRLESILRQGIFAVTGELVPPQGADTAAVAKKAALLKGSVDAVNVTDNRTACAHLSSWAGSLLALREGLEPVYQMVCRDRNRLAMQADILGAYALGIRNMLCLSGDHQSLGDHPGCKKVYDLDSVQLIDLVRTMRDEGTFQNGRAIAVPPRMFIGAAANPFGDPVEFRVLRLAKKVAAGADFIQTQSVYNMQHFRQWLAEARDAGLTERVFILAGVLPLKSVGMARFMQKNVPGMDIPEALVKRIEGVEKKQQGREGIRICCEQLEEMKEMKGLAGIHLMVVEWEHRVPEILEQAKLLPRPMVEAVNSEQ